MKIKKYLYNFFSLHFLTKKYERKVIYSSRNSKEITILRSILIYNVSAFLIVCDKIYLYIVFFK